MFFIKSNEGANSFVKGFETLPSDTVGRLLIRVGGLGKGTWVQLVRMAGFGSFEIIGTIMCLPR